MTNDITEEEINKAIDNCHFRHDVGGVRICAGDVIPCFKHIEDGKCSMLRELFKRKTCNKAKKMIKELTEND